jgi:hypothetical protein
MGSLRDWIGNGVGIGRCTFRAKWSCASNEVRERDRTVIARYRARFGDAKRGVGYGDVPFLPWRTNDE